MIETMRLPLGSDVQDDAAWYCTGHPTYGPMLVAMRDEIREATQQDWKLEHTGGGCTLLSLQGEGVEWTIVGDFFAPTSRGDLMDLFCNPSSARETGDYEQTVTLAEGVPFRDLIVMCKRLAETGSVSE